MLHHNKNVKFITGIAASLLLSFASVSAGAVSINPFATPLSAGDNTNGSANATAFEDFAMTTLSTTAADALFAEISITINPFLTDLAGDPANDISIGYSINGGALVDIAITSVAIPTGTVGVGGLGLALMAGDTLSFVIDGTAGQSGNIVSFAVETTVVPVPAALPLFMAGLAGLGFVGRRKAVA